MIRFSLRRGSGSLGGAFPGAPPGGISEADVLAPGPQVFITGEALGLRTRDTSVDFLDDLDALGRVRPRRAPVGNCWRLDSPGAGAAFQAHESAR